MAVWGDFHGIVKDKITLARIPGATISSNKGVSTNSFSDPGGVNDGKYILSHPPDYDITLTCTAPGYTTVTVSSLTLGDGQRFKLDFRLSNIENVLP